MRSHLFAVVSLIASIAVGSILLGACQGRGENTEQVIDSRRILAIAADPLEVAAGEPIEFRAVISESDGELYEGSVVWSISNEDMPGAAPREIEPEDADSEQFTWQVPAAAELEALFGKAEQRGYLLRITATVGDSGSTAYKRFIVSQRPAADRAANPVLQQMIVEAGGERLVAGEDGVYETDSDEVTLTAVTDEDEDDLDFAWYSISSEFEPDRGATQDFETDDTGLWRVYCIVRNEHDFEHDNSSYTALTGIAWWRGAIGFE